jgi:septum formation protein
MHFDIKARTSAPHLILASGSPRRAELLVQLGVSYSVLVADLPEIPQPTESPEQYVQRTAAEKSHAVQTRCQPDQAILAADTEVVLGGEIFGKPRDFAHAAEMLNRLSGREHQVLSAVSLRHGENHWQALCVSTVAFRVLAADEIEAYWQSGEPVGKAGAYAVQGKGAVFVRHLAGSYSGVMGLPLFETAQLLRQLGFAIPGLSLPPSSHS